MLDNLRHHDLLATRCVLYPTLEHHVLEPTRAAHELHQNTNQYVYNNNAYFIIYNINLIYIYICMYNYTFCMNVYIYILHL